MRPHFLWVEKYRPKTVADCILTEPLKTTFQKFIEQGEVPNLLLVGPPGCGKTTVALAMLNELGCDVLEINSSLRGDMDTLRNEISNYASSVSLSGGRKYVILDEADYLNWKTQPALRNFMETYASNCGFILTANYQNKIIPALQSRCAIIEFDIDKKTAALLMKQFLARIIHILDSEKVEYDKKVLVEVIVKHYPDWRRIINELQRYASVGKIDEGILANFESVSLIELVQYMKRKDFTAVRKWVAENLDNDTQVVFREFYDAASQYFAPTYIPALVIAIAKYQHMALFAVDPEINLAAFMVEVMVEAIWKS